MNDLLGDDRTDPRGSRAPQRPNAWFQRVLRGEGAPSDLEETRAVLGEMARRKGGDVPPELMAELVLAVTDGTDWPTRRAAMEALLRRAAFAERDELCIDQTPGGGLVHGVYRLKGRPSGGHGRRTQRPYQAELVSLEPFRGSCDCADFLRGSLGICKHLLVVLGHVLTSERRIAAARRELAAPPSPRLPVLRWDSVRPFRGDGDRLLGLRLERATTNGTGRGRGRAAAARTDLDDWCVDGRPAPSTLVSVDRRRELLRRLAEAHARQALEMEPGARALVDEELARAERRRSALAAAPALLAQTKTLKRKLYPYQREGVRRCFEARRLLLADDMGLGKTTQAIAVCHALYRAQQVARGLVVVPASLKDQWLREWMATTDTPAAILEGRAEERRSTLRRTKRGFLLMSYEQLLRDLAEVHRFAPEVVVIDEAQRIKNWATKSSLSVKTLSPEWRLVLTGTPMENRLEELASVLDWVDDVALTPKWRLTPWHTSFEGNGGRGRAGARNLDTLRERLAPCVLRRVRQEVLAQLPPRTDTRVPVPMTEQQRAEHDELLVPIASLVHRAQQRPLTQAEFLRLMSLLTTQRIISNGLGQLNFEEVWPTIAARQASDTLLEGLFSPKLAELRRLIEELAVTQGRKVVVFSQWRAMLRLAEWAIRDVLADAGLKSAFFTGAESQRLRTQNVVDFHDDPRCAVLLLSDAGGVGLNLQRAASACINLELPWNPAVLEQRVGRIYRLGQQAPIDVYNLVADYGIEARIAGLIASKKALFSGLFDGTTDEVRFDGTTGFLADIQRIVEPATLELPAQGEPEAESDSGELSGPEATIPPPALPAPGSTPVPKADEVTDGGSALSPGGETAPPATERADAAPSTPLLGRLRLPRTQAGAVRIEAPPEAADELLGLLEGLVALLHQSRAGRSASVDSPP